MGERAVPKSYTKRYTPRRSMVFLSLLMYPSSALVRLAPSKASAKAFCVVLPTAPGAPASLSASSAACPDLMTWAQYIYMYKDMEVWRTFRE